MRGGGRKKLKQGALQGGFDLQVGQTIRRVVSLRGSNIIEVEDAESLRTLCLLPARFNKILWIRKGHPVLKNQQKQASMIMQGFQTLMEVPVEMKGYLLWKLIKTGVQWNANGTSLQAMKRIDSVHRRLKVGAFLVTSTSSVASPSHRDSGNSLGALAC